MRIFLLLTTAAAFLAPLQATIPTEAMGPDYGFGKTPEERCSDGVWLVRTGDYDQAAAEVIIQRSCLEAD